MKNNNEISDTVKLEFLNAIKEASVKFEFEFVITELLNNIDKSCFSGLSCKIPCYKITKYSSNMGNVLGEAWNEVQALDLCNVLQNTLIDCLGDGDYVHKVHYEKSTKTVYADDLVKWGVRNQDWLDKLEKELS